MSKILIVEDDFSINNLLRDILIEDHQIMQAYDGELAYELIKQEQFDLIILDLMLPILTGETLIELIKGRISTPILIITAKSEIETLENVFELGADDYIAKPFRKREVIARVNRLLKNTKNVMPAVSKLSLGLLEMDLEQYKVYYDKNEIVLTVKEYDLLKAFLSQPSKVFTKAELFETVWEKDYDGDDNTLNVHISRLRNKLIQFVKEDPIETIWGVGFKIKL